LSKFRQRNFLPHLILIFIIPHLIPLNSTQTLRHLLSHLCGKADGEFELRVSCRSRERTCEGLRRWCAVGGRCRFPNQLFLNRLPSPIHPHCSRMVPRPHHCAAGAWRAGNVFMATWSDQISRDRARHEGAPPPPPASQPDHLRWCWLDFCDPPSSPDQIDHSAACVCSFLRNRNLGLWRAGGGSTLGVCEGS
jgi:hypothetical protein